MLLALIAPALLIASPAPPSLEETILAELNFARTQPRRYAATLRAYRTLFRGKVAMFPDRAVGLLTSEGTAAVDEAIRFLEQQVPAPPFAAAPLLARVARVHVAEQGVRGATGHRSGNGDTPRDRSRKLGGGDYIAETITYGPSSAVDVVRQLIVDDGVPGRGHRRIVFAAEMRFTGTACGPHLVYRVMCVTEYARTATGAFNP